MTLDTSSLHGIVYFGVLDPFDIRVKSMVEQVEKQLAVQSPFGGYMRSTGDRYFKTSPEATPNAWCITTLWMAQYYMKDAKTRKDLERSYGILRWTKDRSTITGILPEHINPYTGAHLSASPLVWSHAEFVITLDDYIKKYKSLS